MGDARVNMKMMIKKTQFLFVKTNYYIRSTTRNDSSIDQHFEIRSFTNSFASFIILYLSACYFEISNMFSCQLYRLFFSAKLFFNNNKDHVLIIDLTSVITKTKKKQLLFANNQTFLHRLKYLYLPHA